MSHPHSTALAELLALTARFQNRPDQVQGPGGNASVKTEDGTMYIKASGFRFEELAMDTGVSAVNAAPIAAYFRTVQPKDKAAEEKAMLGLIASNTLHRPDGSSFPKPSMETGFHAVLGKYVLHTHSVWSNLINCAENRMQLLDALQKSIPFKIAHLPFVSPGFGLSYLISEAIRFAEQEGQAVPEVFMLSSHGIIAHAGTAKRVAELLETIDAGIREILGLKPEYPHTELLKTDGFYTPASEYASLILQKMQPGPGLFEQVLFPDQTVFFTEQISFHRQFPGRSIQISRDYHVAYHGTERDARNAHETLTAFLFILDTLRQAGYEPALIDKEEVHYINDMEMEKYRKTNIK